MIRFFPAPPFHFAVMIGAFALVVALFQFIQPCPALGGQGDPYEAIPGLL